MDETVKFIHQQQFNDEDFLTIKCMLKDVDKKHNENKNLRQVPSAFFIIFASMAFVSYMEKDIGGMIFQIIASVICVLAIFFMNVIDGNGVLLYKLIFAKEMMKEIVFYKTFMECHHDNEITIIMNEQVKYIYESEHMLFFRLKENQHKYLFISRRNMDTKLYLYLKDNYHDLWHTKSDTKDFRL